MPTTAEIIAHATRLFEDLNFNSAREWKAAKPDRKVVGYMPIYVPREIIHAGDMLPLGIVGGGDQLEVIHGDAYYQSYICRIPRSTVELGVSGRLDFVDGMLFPSICDVIRNLSGMWKIMFPQVYVRYFDVPQNYRDEIGGNYYIQELAELRHDLETLRGKPITDDELRNSIALYDENRRLVCEIYAFRAEQPWQAPGGRSLSDHARRARSFGRAAHRYAAQLPHRRPRRGAAAPRQLPHRAHRRVLRTAAAQSDQVAGTRRLLRGRQQPASGHALAHRRATEGDPIRNLALAFLRHSESTAAKYEPDLKEKGQHLVRAVKRSNAEGVIFACPSFCDPALLDRPMLQHVLAEAGVSYIAFKYAENSGQMQPIREQAGTFADSIKLWSEQ